MSRQNNCRNKTEVWPYLCRFHVRDSLRNRTTVDQDTGCWIWHGWMKGRRPTLYLKGSRKAHITAQANHLYWWLEHDDRIEWPYMLVHVCKTQFCLNPAHHEKSSHRKVRTWTMREVKALREEYWGTEVCPGKRPGAVPCASPITMTASAFNVSQMCIIRFMNGAKCRFSRWSRPGITREMVQAELDKNMVLADKLKRRRKSATTIEKISKKYDTAMMAVCDMVRGRTYKAAGGPTGPVKQSAHKLRVA